MIAYIRGKVAHLAEAKVIVDVHDIGYQIFITSRDASAMPPAGSEVMLHTFFNVKEDAMQLFGFLSRDDMEIFKLLLGVNGVGPKAALGILSVMSADDIRFAVLADDAKTISKAPGIGTKTARKLILDLKDKVSLEDAFEKRLENQNGASVPASENDAASEAVQALVALGYSSADALKAIRKADIAEGMSTEEILKSALKNMSFL
ncbi:Holliday junction branch migration protein RuvA [Lachnospiraceae bacterium 46-15]